MLSRTVLNILPIIRQSNIKKIISYGQPLFICECKFYNTRKHSTTLNNYRKKNTRRDKIHYVAPIISSLNFKCAEDAAPFYELPISTLYQIRKITINDVRNGSCQNRLYYISSRIQCPPALLSEALAKRTFVYNLSFEWIDCSLSALLEKGVEGDRILRDLWVLKYHHRTISDRLQRIKDMGIHNLFPWMVRCSPNILNRYLQITAETKSILGDTNSTQTYLASRLNISNEKVEAICTKLPALKTIRATKVKHFLDFLINEGFGIEEIANKPRILTSSPKTIKQRLEQLRQLGITDINLNLLCRSKKDYKKVCESLEAEK